MINQTFYLFVGPVITFIPHKNDNITIVKRSSIQKFNDNYEVAKIGWQRTIRKRSCAFDIRFPSFLVLKSYETTSAQVCKRQFLFSGPRMFTSHENFKLQSRNFTYDAAN